MRLNDGSATAPASKVVIACNTGCEFTAVAGIRNDNAVGFSSTFLDDPHETSARVFLEQKHERLAFDLNLFSAEGALIHGWSQR